jgi:hypothetical protein
MDIADIIASIQRGLSPDQAVLQAGGAMPQQQQAQAAPPTQAPQTPIPNAPQGQMTPVTNPQPSDQSPKATQSPPDLANMYIELMRKNQNAAQLDSGLTTIAAGFSKYPETRAALLNQAGHHAGGMSLSAQDLIAFDKQRTEAQNMLIRKAAMPALMKQYNMSPAQIQTLEAGGKLDDVIQHYSTENLSQVKDESGQTMLIAPRSGKVIATIGSEKEDPTEYVNGPNGQELRNKRTGERVGGAVGLPPDRQLVQLPDGSWTPADKNAEPGSIVGRPEAIGDKIFQAQNELADINKQRAARGEKPMTPEELIKLKQTPATNINVGTDGSVLPSLEKGYDYERGADGKVLIDQISHRPKLYKIEGGSPADEAAALAKKNVEADDKKNLNRVQAEFTASNVGEAVKSALQHVDTPGVVGIGSKTIRGLPGPGGLPHDKYDAALKTITSNITIDTLARMRQASPTGGALGNVSDYEDKMLQSVIAPLATFTDAKEARRGLIRVQAAMELLANDNFNKDPAKFKAALEARMAELGSVGKPGTKVERIK